MGTLLDARYGTLPGTPRWQDSTFHHGTNQKVRTANLECMNSIARSDF